MARGVKRGKKRMTAKERRAALEHLQAVAQEAHTLGRIYERMGNPRNPANEYARVDEMCKAYLKRVECAARRLP